MSNKYRGEITFDIYTIHKHQKKKIFYYITDIKKSLLKHKLVTNGSKKELEKRLFLFYDRFMRYDTNDIKTIMMIQNRIKNKKNITRIKSHGIGIIDKSKCVNQEDFYTLDNINDIDEKYFFSYEKDNKIYFFDIRSFKKLLKNSNINPYTQEEIPNYAIYLYKKRIKELISNNDNIKHTSTIEMTPDQKFQSTVLDVFQKIDMLNVAAGGIDMKWFMNLGLNQLKLLYKIMEDIWNYRANLNQNQKNLIVPQNDMFLIPVYQICSYTSHYLRNLQYIILNEINKLISSSPNNTHCSTGCYYVLTALVEVSPDCASALPWLIQYT